MEKILQLNPAKIYPGHGPVIEDPIVKIKYYIEHRLQRENQILECLETAGNAGLDASEIVRDVYRDTPVKLWPAAEVNVSHHLEKLEMDQKISRNGTKWKIFS